MNIPARTPLVALAPISKTQCHDTTYSTTSGTNAHHITSFQGHGPALTLNGRWCRESTLDYLAEHVFWHGRLIKGQTGFGDIRTLHNNLLGSSPSLRFLFRTLGNIRVFQIKVLSRHKKNHYKPRKRRAKNVGESPSTRECSQLIFVS